MWRKLVEKGCYSPMDLIEDKCDYCGKNTLCKILEDNEGKKLKICEKCMEGL